MGNNKFPPLLRIRLSTVGQFCPNGGTIPQKRGEYFCCPPIFVCVSDAKFNVDYDSAIKHDLILFFGWLMAICSFALKGETVLTPQNQYHTLKYVWLNWQRWYTWIKCWNYESYLSLLPVPTPIVDIQAVTTQFVITGTVYCQKTPPIKDISAICGKPWKQ